MTEPAGEFDCILLRHGETEDLLARVVSGQRDLPLTPTGRAQARSVAWRLVRFGISRILTSDLQRARETASIIADILALPPPSIDPRLRERHWGERQGQPRRGLERNGEDIAPPGGESLGQLHERILAALREVPPRTLVVTHAGPIRVALESAGRPVITPGPCEWTDFATSASGNAEEIFPVTAQVMSTGEFVGRAVYVGGHEDLDRITSETLILLCECPKAVAIEAMARGAATVNLMRSLTAHLTYGRVSVSPYAVALHWHNGYPRDGQRVRLRISPPTEQIDVTPLPDIPLAGCEDVELLGGKGAGLQLLEANGIRVPPYHIISTAEVAHWQARGGIEDMAADWVHRMSLDSSVRWAVRSSADVEDNVDDPMSGSFESALNCHVDEVPAAVVQVIRSSRNPEIALRLRSGRLRREPRVALVVQQMVTPVRMAGAVFLPEPRAPATFLVESRWRETGESLMDGRSQPDLTARFDRHCRLVQIEFPGVNDSDRTVAQDDCLRVASQGLAIYLATGRGDLEFAVGTDGTVSWLQARPLNEAVEIIDRTGFHPAAVAYYRNLAFRVAEANCTPHVYFRCFDLDSGVFGYSVGIRERDRAFHAMLRDNPEHLSRVTSFGWKTEQRMAEVVASLDSHSPEEVLDCLTLHGAVQLPFSIPMNSSRMDRYRSTATDNHPSENLLERFLREVDEIAGLRIGVNELIRLLRQPLATQSAVVGLETYGSLLHCQHDPSDEQLLACVIPDLRDIPDLSLQGLATLRDEFDARLSVLRQDDPSGKLLDADIRRRRQALSEGREERDRVFTELRERIPAEMAYRLARWAEYLEMKSETNETHCLYRGKCFLWFARIGFMP